MLPGGQVDGEDEAPPVDEPPGMAPPDDGAPDEPLVPPVESGRGEAPGPSVRGAGTRPARR